MYVCLCNSYRDTEILELVQEGFANATEAYVALGNGPCCGQCLQFAQEIMDQARGEITT